MIEEEKEVGKIRSTDETFDYMSQIKVINREILRKTAKKRELESCLLPSAIRYDKDKVQTSPRDHLSKICAEIAEEEKNIIRLQNRKAGLIEEIDGTIEKLPCNEEKTVLSLYWIGQMKMHDIADNIGYSIPSTYRFFRCGMKNISQYIEKQSL